MTLNNTEYFYIRNGQGDITGLIDTAGTQVVSYIYDSCGKLVSIDGSLKDTVGLKNPYRYRGYRYDTETGLYYLQSRYYNPEMGRYINADNVEFLGASGTSLGYNLFAYCDNNPVNKIDPSGYSTASLILDIASIILSIAMIASGGIWIKIFIGIGIGIASIVITLRDYDRQISKIRRLYRYGSNAYKYAVADAVFWKNLGLISAAITLVCSVIAVPLKILAKSTGIAVINAMGLCRGLALSNTLLAYDLTCALNHTPKYKY